MMMRERDNERDRCWDNKERWRRRRESEREINTEIRELHNERGGRERDREMMRDKNQILQWLKERSTEKKRGRRRQICEEKIELNRWEKER